MEEREGVAEDGARSRTGRTDSGGNCVGGVSGVGGVERRVFVLRDEELVEESEAQERLAQNSKNKGHEGSRVLDVSPAPGRENWRLRESKSTAGELGGGVEERRGMSMTDIWPKDWGGKCFSFDFLACVCVYVFRKVALH
jgi:hypothetical protein